MEQCLPPMAVLSCYPSLMAWHVAGALHEGLAENSHGPATDQPLHLKSCFHPTLWVLIKKRRFKSINNSKWTE